MLNEKTVLVYFLLPQGNTLLFYNFLMVQYFIIKRNGDKIYAVFKSTCINSRLAGKGFGAHSTACNIANGIA